MLLTEFAIDSGGKPCTLPFALIDLLYGSSRMSRLLHEVLAWRCLPRIRQLNLELSLKPEKMRDAGWIFLTLCFITLTLPGDLSY